MSTSNSYGTPQQQPKLEAISPRKPSSEARNFSLKSQADANALRGGFIKRVKLAEGCVVQSAYLEPNSQSMHVTTEGFYSAAEKIEVGLLLLSSVVKSILKTLKGGL